ncbi:ATP-dependent helicase [Patescibacteria group bacterium]
MQNLLDNLNAEQKKAATHESGPLLIVAGAGTGKTTVISKRIAWLIEQKKANSDEILALTFTDKAAEEMEERVDQLLPYGHFDLWISTFHSFCDRILRDYALEIGLTNNYKLLNTTAQWMLVKKNFDRFNLDYYRPFGNPTKFIHALIKHFSRCKDEGIGTEEYLEYVESMRLNQDNAESGAKVGAGPRACPKVYKVEDEIDPLDLKKLEEVSNAYHVYQQILLENDAMDFGDLIQCTLKLFKERPNILKILREKFKYILVDEFQDTNWAQYELIKMLSAPKNNITCVADDDQSIYLFRGSSVNNVLQFAKDYPECEEVVLIENYRSKQDILDLSYNFIQQNNPNRLEYQLNQDDIIKKRAKEKGIDLKDYESINKKLKSNESGKAIIEHLHCETLEDEVDAVIGKILEIHEKHTPNPSQEGNTAQESSISSPISEGTGVCKEQISWSDFAILVRANDTAKPFINSLDQAGIPYQFYSLRGLYNKPIILDILAYLKLLDDYHETSALYRIFNISMWRISYDDFSKLNYASFKSGKSLYTVAKNDSVALGLSENTIKTITNLINLIEKHSKIALEKKTSEVLTAFLNDSGYLKYLVNNENKKNRRSIKFLGKFYKKIKDFEDSENDPKLKLFMDQIEMEIEAGDEGSLSIDLDVGPDMVRIMTIHSAKGLEFPYVFIVNLVDKKFPTICRKEPIQIPDALVKEILTEGDIHLEEERRLFYVAMTRAKQGLFFSTAEDYGGTRKKKVSRFLIEMGYGESGEKFQISSAKSADQNKSKISNDKYQNKTPAYSETYKMQKESDIVIEKATTDAIYTLPSKFSYTQLAAFEKCPLQYKFAHILRIPIVGKSMFSFGKTMHSTLQRFFALMNERKSREQSGLFGGDISENKENNDLPTVEDLLHIYEECWIDEWYDNEEEREKKKKEGKLALKEFYELHKDNWPNAIHLEQGFNLRIGKYTLKGMIDRVDLLKTEAGQNCVEIVDYKTGGTKTEKDLKFADKEQLFIYQLAAMQCFNIKPEKLTFYYLESNKSVSFIGSDSDLEKVEKKILERIEKIKQSDFAHNSGFWCGKCDYSNICEYRKL